jgi:DNA repair exonuclease SbcCD ATPase subunit
MQLVECTLEELLAYEKASSKVSRGIFSVPTKFGFKQIEAIDYTAQNEDTFRVVTEKQKVVETSTDHILFSNSKEIHVRDIVPNETTIETIDGEELVVSKEFIGKFDLIDIQVAEVKEFYTQSGVRTHNSTLSDVIKFAIFGKLENKKLKDMANRLNKNAYVKVEMVTRKGKVEIERGIEPGFFKLKINGKEIDKAGKRSVQEFLEEEILEMPFYVFSNTLSLSINDFKSFLRMSSFDKKAIIDKIFGLQVINQMREILKYQTKKLKDAVDDLGTSISAFTKSFDASQREFDDLEARIKESSTEKKTQLIAEKELYEGAIGKHNENLQKIAQKLDKVQEGRKKLTESISGDRQLLATLQEKIDLYDNSQCPTCQTNLETDFHHDLKNDYIKSQKEAVERHTEKDAKMKELTANYQKLDKLRTEQRSALTAAQVKLNYTNSQLAEMGEEIGDHQTSSLKNMMADFTEKIQEKKEEQIKHQKAIAFYGLAEEILGEKGVKQLAIKSILPPLNAEISKLVKTLGIEHRIIFNEEFDARITHFGIEVSPDTLSTGEMKKVDFAVLLSVIRMMKMKYPFMNMIFLDEIFSSIDGDGQYHILKILREIVKDYGMNIFVISHYPLSYTEFDYKLEITKNNGFSTFEINAVE